MWVRLEARPFHIPSRIALLGWSRGFVVAYGGQFGDDDGPLCLSRCGRFMCSGCWFPLASLVTLEIC